MVNRSAFTMIELIFAIVIISISVLSLPMMNQVIAKNTEGSIVQEAIFAASAELNQVLSNTWDEESIEGNAYLARVVRTNPDLCDNNTKLRPGHINQPYHRRCTDTNLVPILNLTATPIDSLNDDAHINANILVGGTSASGYKDNYTSIIEVTSPSTINSNEPDTNNTKRIRVRVSNANGVIVQLDTFSANIGEVDYYKRSY